MKKIINSINEKKTNLNLLLLLIHIFNFEIFHRQQRIHLLPTFSLYSHNETAGVENQPFD